MFGNVSSPETRPPLTKRLRVRRPRVRASQVPVPVTRYFLVKRVLDFVLSSLLAIALAPVVLVTAIAVILTSKGPAFYTQVRLGRFGKPFVIWKLRTMAHNAEHRGGAQWSGPGDRRVTAIGRILRKLHIDEFPQLINVLRGEMSLVGPRPERPEFFPVLSAEIPSYSRRLLVKPGVTGVAQVYLPPDEDIEDVRRKQIHDLYYIQSLSLWLDLRVLVATGLQSIGVPHFLVRPMLFLPKQDLIEGPIIEEPVDESSRETTIAHNPSPQPVARTVT